MNLFKRIAISILLGTFLFMAIAANAEEGGSKEKEGDKNLVASVDSIVVNLMGPTQQYIQVGMTLKLSKPEVADKIKLYMPVVRNNLILLLTTKSASEVETLDGKQKLVKESKNIINKAIELTGKEGVTDVLFTSFIIQ